MFGRFMKNLNINKNKFNALFEAFNFYTQENFDLAIKMLNIYRKSIKQDIHLAINEINFQRKKLTIIIVTHNGTSFGDLNDCIKSVNINHSDVEVLLVNNGVEENFNYKDIDAFKSITILNLNCNVYPSEARNIGAIISNSEWIYFIDDDAILTTPYEEIFDITKKKDFYVARGLVLPKSKDISTPKHYNLGGLTFPSELNIEGNLLIRRSLFLSVGGFDSLLFAHEGKDLTKKIKSLIADEKSLYHPKLVIEHNPSFGEKLFKKKDRNLKSKNYLEYKNKIYAKEMRALFVVVFDDIFDTDITNVENINSKYTEIDFDFIFIYKKPLDLILKLKNSSLRFRSVVLLSYNNSFTSLDERGYSFAAIINTKIEIGVSDIKEATSESLVLGTYSNIGNIGYLLAFDKFGFGQYKISNKILELIEHYKQNKKFLNDLVLHSTKGIAYKSKTDVIFISFHTTDDYYSLKANILKNCLDRLGLHHDIQPFSIPIGMEWPDVCRKKVSFYFELFKKHSNNYKKIVWIDADCNLNYIP
jgi:GT2 family glycosyltransferase